MTPSTRLIFMTFPQSWTGSKLKVTVLVLPHERARATLERIHASGFDGVIVPAPRGVLVALGRDLSVEVIAHAALRALVYET